MIGGTNYAALNSLLILCALFPLVGGLVGVLWKQAKEAGREDERAADIDRRLTRLERHAGFWTPQDGERDERYH
jgi:hypothetical protein